MSSHKTEPIGPVGRAVRWLPRLLAFAFATAVFATLAVVVVIPRATHGVAMTVLTGSMTPTIPTGSIVLVQPVDPGTLRVGDVATYQPEPGRPTFITHRIIRIDSSKTPTRYIFKGDANRAPDIFPVTAKQIRGRVSLHVPYLGAIRDALHTKGGLSGLAVLLLAGYAITQFAGVLRDRRASSSIGTGMSATAAAASEDELVLQLVVATFPISQFDRLLPCLSAQLLRVDALEETTDDRFTVAIARQPAQLDELVDILLLFAPTSLVYSDLVTVPLKSTTDPAVAGVAGRLGEAAGRHAA